ncbi:hypothetical protein BC830DRAFT_1101912 [Chytriomyces sp. MP71]|nr:hypothetical protein BC830DRAFT_1101912 [Chytriomyces sp. MP71]
MASRKTPMKQRVVRKTPLLERIRHAPFDALLQLSEWLSLMEFEAHLNRFSHIIALVLNGVYLATKGFRGEVFTDDEFVEYHSERVAGSSVAKDGEWTWLSVMSHTIELLVVLVSIANTVFLFSRKKEFVLFHHPTEPAFDGDTAHIPKSNNARLVAMDLAPADESLIESDSDSDDDGDVFDKTPTPLRGAGSRVTGNARASLLSTPVTKSLRERLGDWSPWSSTGKGTSSRSRRKTRQRVGPKVPKEAKFEYRWVLDVWDPPQWSINLFCWLSPPAISITYCMNRTNWYYLFALALFTDGTVYMLVKTFTDRLTDQGVLHSQMQGEYNRFVYSLPPFRSSRSVGVSTRD